MKEILNILVVDADEADRMLIRHLFAKTKLQVNIEEATLCSDGIEKIKTQEFDCVLIDYYLPDAKGVEVIEQLREVDDYDSPLIMLSGMGSEELAAEVMKKGAADYVSKNNLNEEILERSVCNAVQIHRLQRKARAAERALLEREKQYRTIIETVSDIIIRLDVDKKIEFINPAIRFFGYEPSEMMGQPIEKFVEKIDGVDYHNDLISQIAT